MKICKNCEYFEDIGERSGMCDKKYYIRHKDTKACELYRKKMDVGKEILSTLNYIAIELEQIKKAMKKC